MTSDKFIGSITNKVYNQIRQSSSDAEARRYLKEHQAKQLTLTDVGSSSLGLVTITNTSVLLLHRKSWQIYKKGWNKHQDIYGRKWWIKYNY